MVLLLLGAAVVGSLQLLRMGPRRGWSGGPPWMDPGFEASRASAQRRPDGSWVVTVAVEDREGGWQSIRLVRATANAHGAPGANAVAAVTTDVPSIVPAGGRFLLTFAVPPLDAEAPVLTIELEARKPNEASTPRLRVPLVGELPADKLLSADHHVRGEFRMTLAGVAPEPGGKWRVAVTVAPIQSWAAVRLKNVYAYSQATGRRLNAAYETFAPDVVKKPPFDLVFHLDPEVTTLERPTLRYEIDTLSEAGDHQMDERVDVRLELTPPK